jgi:PhnB protein
MKKTHVYLNFAGNTEEAFDHYRSIFGGEFLGVVRYRDFGDSGMPIDDADRDRIAHLALSLDDGTMLMGTDAVGEQGQRLKFGTNVYLYLEADSTEEAERLFGALAAGGRVEMPLEECRTATRRTRDGFERLLEGLNDEVRGSITYRTTQGVEFTTPIHDSSPTSSSRRLPPRAGDAGAASGR